LPRYRQFRQSQIHAAVLFFRLWAQEVHGGVINGDSHLFYAVVDKVFALSMAKNCTQKATLNKKQINLLLEFVSKIKAGSTRNLLTQRLKEL